MSQDERLAIFFVKCELHSKVNDYPDYGVRIPSKFMKASILFPLKRNAYSKQRNNFLLISYDDVNNTIFAVTIEIRLYSDS